MDRTERLFKLSIDALLTTLIGAVLIIWFPWPIAFLLALLIAHTINFLINGQLWVLLKHYGLVSNSYAQFTSYVEGFTERSNQTTSIRSVLVFGSLSRDEWSPSSDLDARIVPFPGRINALRACWFLLCERSRALWHRFPLDAYVIDSELPLSRLRADEMPTALSTKFMNKSVYGSSD